jgi:hypothetical protein
VTDRTLQLPTKYFQVKRLWARLEPTRVNHLFVNLLAGPKNSAADPSTSARQQRQRDRTRQPGLTSGHQGPIL